jgi:hypothetical protein
MNKPKRKAGVVKKAPKSQSQADGTAADAPRGETQPQSDTFDSSLSDTFGEAGDPYGRGTLEVPEMVIGSGEATEGSGDVKRKKDEAA